MTATQVKPKKGDRLLHIDERGFTGHMYYVLAHPRDGKVRVGVHLDTPANKAVRVSLEEFPGRYVVDLEFRKTSSLTQKPKPSPGQPAS